MNWIVALTLSFVLWVAYAIPGTYAEKTHGVSVNILFETLAFMGITILLSGKILESLPKVTVISSVQASCMGIGSALGFYFFLQALSNAPGARGFALVLLVAGITFPAQGALFSLIPGAESLAAHQWYAILGMVACIFIYNWKF